jgi:hypothetical protein
MARLFEVITNQGTFIVFPSEIKRLEMALDMLEKANNMRMKPVTGIKSSHGVTLGEAMLNGFYGGERALARFTINQLKRIKQIVDLEEKAQDHLNYLGHYKSINERMEAIMQLKLEQEEYKQRRMEDHKNSQGRTIKTSVAIAAR